MSEVSIQQEIDSAVNKATAEFFNNLYELESKLSKIKIALSESVADSVKIANIEKALTDIIESVEQKNLQLVDKAPQAGDIIEED